MEIFEWFQVSETPTKTQEFREFFYGAFHSIRPFIEESNVLDKIALDPVSTAHNPQSPETEVSTGLEMVYKITQRGSLVIPISEKDRRSLLNDRCTLFLSLYGWNT